tara:strand:+ start:1951 stop:2631 length:681 start_codon:yes stop_codon:yes gene_type:complete
MKKAIVTGASSGLGYEIAKQLLAKGVKVVNLSSSKCNLDVENIKVDLSKHNQLMKAIDRLKKKHKDLDLLVCCAGLMHRNYIGKIPPKSIDHDFSVNVTSNIKLTNAFLPILKKNRGDIAVVISTCAYVAHLETSVYNSTKAALSGYVKSLQLELNNSGDDVRVIGFYPGGFKSQLHIKAKSPLKQRDLMNPEDLAKMIMYSLEMPRNAQVSEIIVDRRDAKFVRK